MAFTIERRPRRLGVMRALLASLFAIHIPTTAALTQQLCSQQNTGSDSAAVSDIYQSNGACSTSCAGYAFAIVQYKSCWCSDYVPADTTSTGSCSVPCPGYPDELCGDESSGLFGYVALGKAPVGTKGAVASSSPPEETSTAQPTQILQSLVEPNFPSIPSPVTVENTVTTSQSVQIPYVSITPSTTPTTTSTTPTPTLIPVSVTSSTPSTTATPTPPRIYTTTSTTSSTPSTSSTSSSSSSTWSATPWTSIMTVTGQVITSTITPAAPPPAATTIVAAQPNNAGGFWNNKAQVGGVFFVVAVALLAMIAAIVFFLLRRRRPSDVATIQSNTGNNTPQRRPSRLSQMGLIGGVQRQATIPSIQTSGLVSSGLAGNSTERSPADTLTADRRNSWSKVHDDRLEPTALWNPLHNNGSHHSIQSFRDDQDYSRRMLRITNPSDTEL